MLDRSFYQNKKVFITGHTGFKGSWMCKVLELAGAEVSGYSLDTMGKSSLFELCHAGERVDSCIGDIRDLKKLQAVCNRIKPEIVIHMAAQPLVRESYRSPVYTYETNVMGTVNILECIRNCSSVKSFVNVTTDKVYKNREWEWGYRENEELNGYDPYSNSKSCSELVTNSYIQSFFRNRDVAISTVRSGNVIGGGDFGADRIIPDCVRSALEGKDIIVRNPYSVRPYQHVLEAVIGYLMIAERQYRDKRYAGSYNIGPEDTDCWTTGNLVSLFCDKWNADSKDLIQWMDVFDEGPHEANYLKLDCSKIKSKFGWTSRWNLETAVEKVIEWVKVYKEQSNVSVCMEQQIREFLAW